MNRSRLARLERLEDVTREPSTLTMLERGRRLLQILSTVNRRRPESEE